jgi:hypothetical protein
MMHRKRIQSVYNATTSRYNYNPDNTRINTPTPEEEPTKGKFLNG